MFSLSIFTVLFLLSSFVVYKVIDFARPPAVPEIHENAWWGVGERRKDNLEIKPFRISIPGEVILDLKWRLKHHRSLGAPIVGAANQYGTNSIFIKEFVDYWLNSYNWTEQEIFLNKYPQFKMEVQGLNIHFLHIKSENPENKKILPLLIVHGWPGSVREFYDAIDILRKVNDKNFVLELIIPSLPGFGFSDSTTKSGLGLVQIAGLLKKLMNRLGHQKFYTQGGDLGSITLQILSVLYPDSVLGFHTNFPVVYTVRSCLLTILGSYYPSWVVKPEHYKRVYPLKDLGLFLFRESGYLHLQSTKPDSLGVAMDDSPVGLASYFLEKFILGSNFSWIKTFNSTDLANKFSYKALVDNMMFYWLTQTASSSFRVYYETFESGFWSDSLTLLRIPLVVPTAIFRAKFDLYMPDGILKEIFTNILQLRDYEVGHFPAFEVPYEFTDDLLMSLKKFEDYQKNEGP